jgi:hypothetical protein
MFALHYFFSDEQTLNGLLHNIHESLKVGGYFIGCCFDGDSVVRLLRERRILAGETLNGVDGDSQIWSITKEYDGDDLPATAEGLGKKIDVEFISIGQKLSEYLVSWTYLQTKMAEIGLELLNNDELRELGLTHSSNTFRASHRMAEESGKLFAMSDTQKQFSFLNRWFIFRRRELKNTLPELHTLPPSPPQPLPIPSAEPAAAAPAAAAPAAAEGNEGIENEIVAPALYEKFTEVLDKNGVVGIISAIEGPVQSLMQKNFGKMIYTYTIDFSDGNTEIVYESDLEPIPGSQRLRYTGERSTQALSAGVPVSESSPDSMPSLERIEAEAPSVAEEAAAVVATPSPKLDRATGPIYQFYHKSAAKDDFGIKLKHWRRYLSPYAPFTYHDLQDPSIEYPSLEAAWYGSRIGVASNKPGLRAPMFSIESNTHQSAATERGEVAFNPEQMDSYVEEGKKYSGLIDSPTKLKRTGIDINTELWNEKKEQILIDLVKQRYERDPVYKHIIDMVRANKARLYYYSISGKDSDLAGTLSGETIRGDNLLGRALMYLAGLTY